MLALRGACQRKNLLDTPQSISVRGTPNTRFWVPFLNTAIVVMAKVGPRVRILPNLDLAQLGPGPIRIHANWDPGQLGLRPVGSQAHLGLMPIRGPGLRPISEPGHLGPRPI